MKIEYGGRVWEFDLEDMTVAQCEGVEKYVGKGLGEWSNQLAAGSVKSVVALWWVLRRQSGEDPGPVSQPGDDFRPVKLLAAFNAAMEAEAAALAAEQAEAEAKAEAEAARAAEADPTLPPPAPSSPASAGTTTTPASAALNLSLPG